MTLRPVSADLAPRYVAYSRKYGREHDESFLPAAGEIPDADHPAYLLEERGRDIGAMGLRRTKPYTALGRGRIVIFHVRSGGEKAYRLLFDGLRESAEDLTYVYGFLPEEFGDTRRSWESLGLAVERYAYLMSNDIAAIPDDTPPQGHTWRPLGAEDTAGLAAFRDLANENFADMAGHVKLSLDGARKMVTDPFALPGGMVLLEEEGVPVETLQVEKDEDAPEGSFIGGISVRSDRRGRGLGRLLVRRGLALSRRLGFCPTGLSVNAENENATRLYLDEGFRRETVKVCYGVALPG